MPTDDTLRRAPKALLHDHLDGGLRPQTIIELAEPIGYQRLPDPDGDKLGAWFREAPTPARWSATSRPSTHTWPSCRPVDGLHRVAAECAQDLAADGVVYAEVRYAPEQHLVDGLSLEEVVEAVNEGFRDGERLAAESGTGSASAPC